MKYQTGDAITGCMIFIPISIATGYGAFRYLMSVERQDMISNSVKNLYQRLFEDTNLNLINIFQKKISELNIMSSKKKKVSSSGARRPIDGIREMMEDLNLQISDLTQIVKDQKEEIRTLKAKWNAKESLEKEEKEKKEREADQSWFWAARTSD